MAENANPFHILALAPFCGDGGDRCLHPVVVPDREGLDRAVKALAPSVTIPVDEEGVPGGALTMDVSDMHAFTPRGVIKACPFLDRLSRASDRVAEENRKGAPEERIVRMVREEWPDLPLNLTAAGKKPIREPALEPGVVDDILDMVAVPGRKDGAAAAAGDQSVSVMTRMEGLLARLLKTVFDHEAFRELEASWRGAETLVRQGPVHFGHGVSLALCPVTAVTLEKTLETLKASLAPDPPGLILVDLPLESSPPYMERLAQVADLAADLLVPAATWAPARFFHLTSWNALKTLPYLAHHLEDAAYAKWRRLREHPGARWTALLVNRFLVRPAYGKDHPPRPAFFEEEGAPRIAPVWALGALMAQSADRWGWPTRFTGADPCMLRGLAVDSLSAEGPSSLERLLSEDRAAEFAASGFMPLVGKRGKDTAFLPHGTSLSGDDLAFQAFLNSLVGSLYRLRAARSEAEGAPSQGDLIAYLTALFRRTGHEPPDDLFAGVETGPSKETARIRISLTPPATLLRKAQPVAFELTW